MIFTIIKMLLYAVIGIACGVQGINQWSNTPLSMALGGVAISMIYIADIELEKLRKRLNKKNLIADIELEKLRKIRLNKKNLVKITQKEKYGP